MDPEVKPEFLTPADFALDIADRQDLWFFDVKSYQINITSGTKPYQYAYAAGILITDNEDGKTGHGEKHAVLQFYWAKDDVPSAGVPNESGLLHLNFSVSEYAGIMKLLKGPVQLRCYYKKKQSYGGIMQVTPVKT